MKNSKRILRDIIFTLCVLALGFLVTLIIENLFEKQTLIPMIFVFCVFFISLYTDGYLWGIFASLISGLIVNYAFTYPYYALDLITPESVFSLIVMLIVAIMTSALTTKLKKHEQTKAEAERERMRANLLRAVSHDLRTPLTTIYGSCSAIIENYDNLDNFQKLDLLKDIRKDSQWLTRMVENLLSVTRIDARNVLLNKTPTVLEELVDAVLFKFSKRYPDTNVTVDIPDDFISIPMDAMLIEQVLINILENAVDHAHGMTELVFSVTLKDKKAVFSITDNGCGIDEEKLDGIFTGYQGSANSPTDGSRNNMGIGLSVCYTIIKAHGSEIFAENLKGRGARFTFALETEDSTNGK